MAGDMMSSIKIIVDKCRRGGYNPGKGGADGTFRVLSTLRSEAYRLWGM